MELPIAVSALKHPPRRPDAVKHGVTRTIDGRLSGQYDHHELQTLEVGLEVSEHRLNLVWARGVLAETRLKHEAQTKINGTSADEQMTERNKTDDEMAKED